MRPAKLSELKAGQIIHLDDGFTCRSSGPAHIHQDTEGLYFYCDEGRHMLDGQLQADGDTLTGVFIPDPA